MPLPKTLLQICQKVMTLQVPEDMRAHDVLQYLTRHRGEGHRPIIRCHVDIALLEDGCNQRPEPIPRDNPR